MFPISSYFSETSITLIYLVILITFLFHELKPSGEAM